MFEHMEQIGRRLGVPTGDVELIVGACEIASIDPFAIPGGLESIRRKLGIDVLTFSDLLYAISFVSE